MATDVARLSFDPARLYRGVVPQQGRVSLEAEQNEQRVIDIEERRKELVDIVGPAGTPDDGYAVSGAGGSTDRRRPGTMYVGGWRVELDADLDDAQQPDWLDRPARESESGGREHVLLLAAGHRRHRGRGPGAVRGRARRPGRRRPHPAAAAHPAAARRDGETCADGARRRTASTGCSRG